MDSKIEKKQSKDEKFDKEETTHFRFSYKARKLYQKLSKSKKRRAGLSKKFILEVNLNTKVALEELFLYYGDDYVFYPFDLGEHVEEVLEMLKLFYYLNGTNLPPNIKDPDSEEADNSVNLFIITQMMNPAFQFYLITFQVIPLIFQIAIDRIAPKEDYDYTRREASFLDLNVRIITYMILWKGGHNRLKKIPEYQNFLEQFPTCKDFAFENQYKIDEMEDVSMHDFMKARLCCGNCKKKRSYDNKFLRCGRCRKVYYCDRNCQKLHWKKGHKHRCVSEKNSN